MCTFGFIALGLSWMISLFLASSAKRTSDSLYDKEFACKAEAMILISKVGLTLSPACF